ncbi:maltose alpha-D-glucosyltransferase/alpha-amylase [Christiangramia gaetbulicola]|uniref:Maltokinase n=1 Tax=Christiangramia gaetbulicola TaxID=703340 RepID=A0A2T6AHD6_9FLAO|nr:maltose alpha-D-glucosyltransferase [Christiangramia gaetbulicola]PTX43216.1 maltose alpha-D-glucosyltransferase/alpha-amylase [Christiangramia gaetbulicola]
MAKSSNSKENHWYKDAIIYELHIKAFFDSNGDGIGDFEGLMQKLDYLEDLGVTAIWLLPFYPSPLRDDGYDIADYYNINPSYGNVEDFKIFLNEAHSRGLKVITELVINHTSDQHEWFQRARKAPKGSEEREYYVWSDDPHKYKDARIIFTDTEPSNWSWDAEAQSYYWHRFFSHQPDLNFDNPKVQQEVFDIMDYWCKMGVDGFRLDAVPYLFEREDTNCENLPQTHEFLKKLRAHVDKNYDNKLLLAEANMWPEDSAAYFGDGDECHMNYHFPIMPRMFMAVKMEDRYPIIDIIDQTPDIPENCQWGIFLRNHDELTLEMVTDEERDYMYKVYTKDPQAKINVGIRHRLAPLLDNNRSKIELMNMLLFSLPGTPIIYYGDEIGMGDNFYLGDRDGVRTPMQWTADRNAGFSLANPQKLYLPLIIDPEYKYESINVETQQMISSSLLWWMKRIIGMRKKYKAFGRGDIEFLSPSNSKIIAYTRIYKDEKILVLGNLSRFSQPAELDLEDFKGYTPVEVFSHNRFPKITERPYLFTLSPYGYYWFALEKERERVEGGSKIPLLKIDNWNNLLKNRTLQELSGKILPPYLEHRRWFESAGRILQDITVKESIEIKIKDLPTRIIILEVTYNEGLPEFYQLPVSFVSVENENLLNEIPKRGIIAKLKIDKEEGYLFDSVYAEEFRDHLIEGFRGSKRSKTASGELDFSAEKSLIKDLDKEPRSELVSTEQRQTIITYDNALILKLYRKLDQTFNPDIETIKFLSTKTDFEKISRYAGAMRFSQKSGKSYFLGMLQQIIENQGEVWTHVKDSLDRYFERVLTAKKDIEINKLEDHITLPLGYEDFPKPVQEITGIILPERIYQLGEFTAELHDALSQHSTDKDFDKEESSLHYQRSLFSGLQTLTRTSLENLKKVIKDLPENTAKEAKEVLGVKKDILECFKDIYDHKIPVMKIRTHGDYHLRQILWTGREYIMNSFEGDPSKSFSERRIRRSAMRDLAAMIRSLHYAAYSNILSQEYDQQRKEGDLEEWAEKWHYYISRLYIKGYLDKAGSRDYVPKKHEDFKILINTFLLEKALTELNYEIENRPEWIIIPIRGIKAVLDHYKDD